MWKQIHIQFQSKQTHIYMNPVMLRLGPTDSCTREIMYTRLFTTALVVLARIFEKMKLSIRRGLFNNK